MKSNKINSKWDKQNKRGLEGLHKLNAVLRFIPKMYAVNSYMLSREPQIWF